MPLKWVVSARPTLPVFIPEKMAHGAEIAEGGAVDRIYRIETLGKGRDRATEG